MCDDWDDNPIVQAPKFSNDPPIQSQTFGNSSHGARVRDRGNFQRNNDRRFNNRNDNNFSSSQGGDRFSNDRGDRSGGQYNRTKKFGGNRFGGDRNGETEDIPEVLNVPSRFVGRIIGRGGSKINELQTESGARIQVTKDTDGETTVVKLFGNQDAVTKAKSLINSLTTDTIQMIEAKDIKDIRQEEKKPVIVDWQTFLKECEEAESAEWDKYPPIKKEFYVEHPDVTRMSKQDVEKFREENNNIVVDRTFKTLAFLLPAMIHIDGQPGYRKDRGGPAVLIMAPTRELALQIDKEIKKYQYKGITSVCLYGGGNRREQVKVVTEGVDIVIATPGRLNDLVCAGHLNVKTVTYVVLDEADRMLDMGFEPQIRKVMYSIRPTRQTIMTSATWPLGVRRLAQSYMSDPIQIYVGSLDLAATHTVTQVVQIIPDDDAAKLEALMDFAHNLGPDQKVIVFCGKKSRADELASELILSGIRCQTIHGDREQSDREQALVDIADGTVQILIATDVASRGLDIDDITHVLNYDFPRNIEEYVHRVGRTGRAGKSGESISYFTRSDWGQAKELISILEEAQQYVPEEIYQMAERHEAWKEKKDKEGGGRGRGGGRFGGGRRW